MSEQKKPAGFKSAPGDFWIKLDGRRRCKECRRDSQDGDSAQDSHARTCSLYPKDSRVVLDEEEVQQRQALQGQRMESPIDAELRREPIEKRGKPEISDVYRRWVKLGACCNCGASAPSDPHHEDTEIPALRRGARQKPRDTACVSLCRRCHDALTGIGGGYRLPVAGRDGERHERAESLEILRDAQEERLRRALDLLPREWRIEALSAGIARAPEAVLKRALLTGDDEQETTQC